MGHMRHYKLTQWSGNNKMLDRNALAAAQQQSAQLQAAMRVSVALDVLRLTPDNVDEPARDAFTELQQLAIETLTHTLRKT
jgi:hypothetical protein